MPSSPQSAQLSVVMQVHIGLPDSGTKLLWARNDPASDIRNSLPVTWTPDRLGEMPTVLESRTFAPVHSADVSLPIQLNPRAGDRARRQRG